MEINERVLKITGSTPIDKELELGKEVEITIKGSVKYAGPDRDNEDGTFDRYYSVKLKSADINKVSDFEI